MGGNLPVEKQCHGTYAYESAPDVVCHSPSNRTGNKNNTKSRPALPIGVYDLSIGSGPFTVRDTVASSWLPDLGCHRLYHQHPAAGAVAGGAGLAEAAWRKVNCELCTWLVKQSPSFKTKLSTLLQTSLPRLATEY